MRKIIIFIFIGLGSCKPKALIENQVIISKMDTVKIFNLYPELAARINKIEVTPLGNFFKLMIATDSTCSIQWGNSKITNEAIEHFHFSTANKIHFDWENQDFLVLKAGTGSDAWLNVFLPLNDLHQERTIFNTLAEDTKSNLVVAEQFPGTDTVMVIYNLQTQENQPVIEQEKCDAFYHYCLDTISLSKDLLYYRWSTPNKYSEHQLSNERIVRVKI